MITTTHNLPQLVFFGHSALKKHPLNRDAIEGSFAKMSIPLPCPDSDLLEAILRGGVTAEEEVAIEQHLESCEQCRQAVDALAGIEESCFGCSTQTPAPIPTRLQATIDQLKQDPSRADDAGCHLINLIAEPSNYDGSLGRIGDYEILERVGKGGMGVVYRSLDAQLNRQVAIKFLSSKLASDNDFRERFFREARAAANVNHPNTITVHNIDEVNGVPFIVMEFIDGESLQQRLRRMGPLPLTMVARIGLQVSEALAAAHSTGVTHRDIKPSNILLHHDNDRVRLTDFGLAQNNGDPRLTQTGQLLGTPKFMSPEQARGDAFDHRSDLFSLGSLLFAMSVGAPPISANTRSEVIQRVATGNVDSIDDADPTLPRWLRGTIRRLHQLDPRKRFDSASQVAAILRNRLDATDDGGISTADFWDGDTLVEDLGEPEAAEDLDSLTVADDGAIDKLPSTTDGEPAKRSEKLEDLKQQREILIGIILLLICLIPFIWTSEPAVVNDSARGATGSSAARSQRGHNAPIPSSSRGTGRFLLKRAGELTQRSTSLYELVELARDQDVIEILDNAPIALEQPLVIDKPLTIRAGYDSVRQQSYVPRVLSGNEAILNGGMIRLKRPVKFEGIQFEADCKVPFSSVVNPRRPKQSIVHNYNNGAVKLVNCRIRISPGNLEQFCIVGNNGAVDLCNCELLGGGVSWNCPGVGSLKLENCFMVAPTAILLSTRPGPVLEPLVAVRDSTIISERCISMFIPANDAVHRDRVRVEIQQSALTGAESILQLRRIPTARQNQWGRDELRSVVPAQFITWEGRRNLYHAPEGYLTIADRQQVEPVVGDLAHWTASWRDRDVEPVSGEIRYNHAAGQPQFRPISGRSIIAFRVDIMAKGARRSDIGHILTKLGPGINYDHFMVEEVKRQLTE